MEPISGQEAIENDEVGEEIGHQSGLQKEALNQAVFTITKMEGGK